VPASKPSSHPSDRTDTTPVFALKELVNRLHREQHKTQDLLSSLGYALRSFNNLNQFLELIPLMASRVTDADGGVLFLFRPNGQVSLALLHCQDSPQCQDIRKALEIASHQITATATPANATSGALSSSYTTTAALDYQVSRYLGANIHLFGTAILVRNTERGRLYVFSEASDYEWTETRQKLIRLVADQTAVAIANDDLRIELRTKERLDRELEIGAEIQRQLFPRQCPKIPGVDLAARCKTANRVGGDYYDFFVPVNYGLSVDEDSQSGRWGLAIGDVMGKGVPAGLIMTMTRGMLRAEVLNGHSPARILQHLNLVYYADLEKSHRFVTLFYSEYNPQSQILSYSNGAHNPPLLWQAATNLIKRLDTQGMLIGLDPSTQYQDAQVQLQPGDTLLYYTDGATDAGNRNGDRFDEDRLIRCFRWACQHCSGAQAILDYLFDQVQQFIGVDRCNDDDMTLIVMQVRPTPEGENFVGAFRGAERAAGSTPLQLG
jgi:sigma-B regulation protein RsbU (phosphoserine phosphatase)